MNGSERSIKESTSQLFDKELTAGIIFDLRSGLHLLYQTFLDDFQINPVLLSGFLTAFMNFSREITSLYEIKLISLANIRISFIIREDIVFALLSSFRSSLPDNESKLKLISSLFFETFQEIIADNRGTISLHMNEFEEFKDIFIQILAGKSRVVDENELNFFHTVFNRSEFKSENILGIALISYIGDVVYNHNLSDDVLYSAIEFFNLSFQTDTFQNVTSQVIMTPQSHLLISKVGEGLVLVINTKRSLDEAIAASNVFRRLSKKRFDSFIDFKATTSEE